MKKFISFLQLVLAPVILNAQVSYDSITISRCSIEDKYYEMGPKWPDKLKTGEFRNLINDERTIWIRSAGSKEQVKPAIFSLTEDIKNNGTQDVTRCFIPRHSINFYQRGKITRCLLVCFQCDGLHFSDDPKVFLLRTLIQGINKCWS